MEVEITGTPEPTVTWYKDDEPLMDTDGELRQLGNCYLLIIDTVEKRHAGKYMVNASNAGGEAQSIADFAVFEPTPDTMVEVHKTIVYENMADKDLKVSLLIRNSTRREKSGKNHQKCHSVKNYGTFPNFYFISHYFCVANTSKLRKTRNC